MTVTIDGTSGITYPAGTIQGTGYGPAFSVYRSATQTLATNVYTKIQFSSEYFDTANCFDSTTNYRFTPNVAGYYQINSTISSVYNVNNFPVFGLLYKNGSAFLWSEGMGSANAYPTATLATLIYMNGTTDYLEMYALQTSGVSTTTVGDAAYMQFSGYLARGA